MSTYTPTYTSGRKGLVEAVAGSLATLYRRRWLALYFAQREVSRNYRSSYLGFLWALLGPLLMVVLLTLIFSEVVGIRVRDVLGDPGLSYGLFLYCGLLPFLAFNETLNRATNSIRNNAALVQKVVLPLEIFPLTRALTVQIDKIFGVVVLILVVFVMEHRLEWTIVFLPLLMVLQIVFMLGVSYSLAVIGTYLPDIRETLRAFVRVLFFVTPIVWTPDRLPQSFRENFGFLIDLNPLAFLVQAYRDLILVGTLPAPSAIFWFTTFSVALLVGGYCLFVRVKQNFADLI